MLAEQLWERRGATRGTRAVPSCRPLPGPAGRPPHTHTTTRTLAVCQGHHPPAAGALQRPEQVPAGDAAGAAQSATHRPCCLGVSPPGVGMAVGG